MKKLYYLLLISLFYYSTLTAQWVINGTNINNTNAGNVGIGTNNPSYKLDMLVTGTASLRVRSNNAPSPALIEVDGSGIRGVFESRILAPLGVRLGSINNYSLYFTTNDIERMRIMPTGEVGIGTVSPIATLDVNGTARVATIPQDNALTRVLVSDNSGNIRWRTASTLDTNTDNQNLSISSSGTDRTLNISGGTGVNFSVADNDNNSSNEIQDLTFAAGIISLSNDPGATQINLSAYDSNAADDFNGSFMSLTNVPAGLADGDNDSQTLSINSVGTTRTLNISGGNGVNIDVADNDNNSSNEIQDLTFAAGIISLSNDPGATQINLSAYDSNAADDFNGSFTSLTNVPAGLADGDNDSQTLSINSVGTTRTLNISGGNGVNIDVADNDNSATNEIQDLTFAAGIISLSNDPGATQINLSAYDSNAADDFNGSFTSLTNVPAGLADGDNDSQTLSINSVGTTRTLNISGGNGVNIDVADNDNSATNEIQDLSLSGNTLSLTSDGTTVNLAPYMQDLSLSGNTLSLTGDGTSVNLAPYLDNTDNQDLTLSGNTLSLTGDGTTVNLTPYLDNTDSQTLSVNDVGTTRTINISGGNAVNFDVADNDNDSNNEIQDLTLSGNTLSLTGDGTTVSLAPYLDNTDSQTLTFAANLLSITGGNNVDLSPLQDNLGNHSVTQDLLPNSNVLNLGSASSEFGSLYFYRALYTDGGEFLHTRDNCIAIGNASLPLASSGSMNVAIGDNTLFSNSTGANNVAIGFDALTYNTTGNNNVVIGSNSGPTNGNGIYNNSIALGSNVSLTASNQVRIGNSSIMSIGGYQPWSNLSDGRFKKEVREDIPGLAFIEQLRPVSYQLDTPKLNQFLKKEPSNTNGEAKAATTSRRNVGFLAQEVEQVLTKNGYAPIGVETPQSENDLYSLRYSEFVVPLTKAVQELSTLVKTLQQQNEAQQQRIETLERLVGTAAIPALSDKTTSTEALPQGIALYQNAPNPFTQTTVIGAQVPENVQQAKIVVYNLQGLELASYPLRERGKVTMEISGKRFPAGMYLYALVADGKVIDTKKMLLTK